MAQFWRPALVAGSVRRLVLCVALVGASVLVLLPGGAGEPRTGYVASSCVGTGVSSTVPTDYFSQPRGLRTPADGRLDGLDFSLLVVGYADRACLAASEPGTEGLAAPPGESVAVVSYELDSFPGWDTTEVTHLAFVVGGRVVPISGANYSAGWDHWALEVPASAHVGFEVTDAGSTQELSLQTGRRITPSPPVLYRSTNGSPLSVEVRKTVTLEDTSAASDFSQPDDFELVSASLGWFSPVDPLVHAGFRGAFLQVKLSEEAPPHYFELSWTETLSPGHIRLVLPGGQVLSPDPASTTDDAEGDPSGMLLGGTYFFDVPWDFTSGTLEVTPGVVTADNDTTAEPMAVSIAGTARFPVAFSPPKPYRSRAAAASAPHRRHRRTKDSHTARPADPPEGSGTVGKIGVAVVSTTAVVVVPLVVFIPIFVRRRQRRLGPYSYDATGERLDPERLGALAVAGVEAVAPVAESAPPPDEETTPAGAAAAVAPEEPAPRPVPYVAVMGEVVIRDLELPTKRLAVIELLCFLACHRSERFTSSQLRTELWPLGADGKERVSAQTLRDDVSKARRAVGKDHFPNWSAGTYTLGGEVGCDWFSFQDLAAHAAAAEGAERRRLCNEALALVRGELFSGTPKHRYEWAVSGMLVSNMSKAIRAVASMLAESCLADDVPGEAIAGLERALLATRDVPTGDDQRTVAAATDNHATVE
ncbi:MAG: hypothetical protein ACLPQS_14950, partial [Acidimicrobiales bacterium]